MTVHEVSEALDHYPEATWLARALPSSEFRMTATGHSQPSSLFSKTNWYQSNDHTIAFTVAKQEHEWLTINEVSRTFNVDLRTAFGDYLLDLQHVSHHNHWKSQNNCVLPFSHIYIWHS